MHRARELYLLGLTSGELQALRSIVAHYLTYPRHSEVFIHPATQQQTTPEQLLNLLMGQDAAAVDSDERQRIVIGAQACVCRTPGCGHPASTHTGSGGACIICGVACWS